MTERESILNDVRDVLRSCGSVELAIVFGSIARGADRPDSDLDLAVRLRPGSDPLELSATVSRKLGRDVDVIELPDVTVPLRQAILRDGIIVHEGKRGAGAEWWSRALVDSELDAAWYRRMRNAWLARVAQGGVGDG